MTEIFNFLLWLLHKLIFSLTTFDKEAQSHYQKCLSLSRPNPQKVWVVNYL